MPDHDHDPSDHFGISRRDLLASGAAVAAVLPVSAHGQSGATTSRLETGNIVKVSFTVNGDPAAVDVDSRASLLDLLRERLALTGTKKGCDHGQCGACTVHLNDRTVVSCLTLAAKVNGCQVRTIEGVANGQALHPMQSAFIEHDGLQCGYCTPGQIMSAIACVAQGKAGDAASIREFMSGNLCRCGAYVGIVAAIASVAGA